jgi:hypothetical protein
MGARFKQLLHHLPDIPPSNEMLLGGIAWLVGRNNAIYVISMDKWMNGWWLSNQTMVTLGILTYA